MFDRQALCSSRTSQDDVSPWFARYASIWLLRLFGVPLRLKLLRFVAADVERVTSEASLAANWLANATCRFTCMMMANSMIAMTQITRIGNQKMSSSATIPLRDFEAQVVDEDVELVEKSGIQNLTL